MVARLDVKNVPSAASNKTASATPADCPINLPVRRRSKPPSHVRTST
jgi:hypothetical protein